MKINFLLSGEKMVLAYVTIGNSGYSQDLISKENSATVAEKKEGSKATTRDPQQILYSAITVNKTVNTAESLPDLRNTCNRKCISLEQQNAFKFQIPPLIVKDFPNYPEKYKEFFKKLLTKFVTEKTVVHLDGKSFQLDRGQCCFSRQQLADEFSLTGSFEYSRSSIQDAIEYYVGKGALKKETLNRRTLLTICENIQVLPQIQSPEIPKEVEHTILDAIWAELTKHAMTRDTCKGAKGIKKSDVTLWLNKHEPLTILRTILIVKNHKPKSYPAYMQSLLIRKISDKESSAEKHKLHVQKIINEEKLTHIILMQDYFIDTTTNDRIPYSLALHSIDAVIRNSIERSQEIEV